MSQTFKQQLKQARQILDETPLDDAFALINAVQYYTTVQETEERHTYDATYY